MPALERDACIRDTCLYWTTLDGGAGIRDGVCFRERCWHYGVSVLRRSVQIK